MLKPASIFSHHMVLQKNKPVRFWGYSFSDTVTVSYLSLSATTKVCDGKWSVILPPCTASDPFEVTISNGMDTIVYTDVVFGEVWLAGGQSNMELELRTEANGSELLDQLTPDCNVRFYYTPKQSMIDEKFYLNEANTCWGLANGHEAEAWSAVGFHFAEHLAKKLGCPVGIIGCNWGGTSASNWVDEQTLMQSSDTQIYWEEYQEKIKGKTTQQMIEEYDSYIEYSLEWNRKKDLFYVENPKGSWEECLQFAGECLYPGPMGIKNEYRPCGLYETMLSRICPYTIQGFLYYQGESDDHRPQAYHSLFQNLVAKWRKDWQDENLTFLCVQLPMFIYEGSEDIHHWSLIRESQLRVAESTKHMGIAIIPDCGEDYDIHPKDKRPVGYRLYLQALYHTYHLCTREEAYPPMLKYAYPEENKLVICFENIGAGLQYTECDNFEIAEKTGKYVPANVTIDEDKIILTAEGISNPFKARYAWRNLITPTLYGKNGLPVSPFRTNMDEEM